MRHLILDGRNATDVDQMAVDWLEHVNGKHILPKLPVYLRTHIERHLHDQCIEDAMKSMEAEVNKLKEVNKLLQLSQDNELDDSMMVEVDDAPIDDDAESSTCGSQLSQWPQPVDPPVLAPPVAQRLILPRPVMHVGGTQIGVSPFSMTMMTMTVQKQAWKVFMRQETMTSMHL